MLLAGLTVTASLAVACAQDPVGTLMVKPDTFTIAVGQTTFIRAFLQDGMTAMPPPVDATWSVDPDGVITLEPYNGIQKITGVAAGQVVITAAAFDQSAKTGLTITAP